MRTDLQSSIEGLTSRDIIIIDHSTNDGMTYHTTKHSVRELEQGLESFIHRIYYYSKPKNWPTIILVLYYPLAGSWSEDDCHTNPNFLNVPPGERATACRSQADIQTAYVNVASKYQLPLWSLR